MKILTRPIPWPFALLPRLSSATAPPEAVSPSAPTAVPSNPASLPHEEAVAMTEHRAATLRGMFPLLFSRYARHADLWQAVVVERHLSQAANLADLEQRIREVQQRPPFSWSE
jgi:hypothetical protein